jgi:hypothetical protein
MLLQSSLEQRRTLKGERRRRPTPDVEPLVDQGLGNSAYLVDLGDDRALVVDVSLDLREGGRAAQRHGLSVAFAADTHLHADFLSGARQLSATEGTASSRTTGCTTVTTSTRVGSRLRALGTPGDTDEHLSFLLLTYRTGLMPSRRWNRASGPVRPATDSGSTTAAKTRPAPRPLDATLGGQGNPAVDRFGRRLPRQRADGELLRTERSCTLTSFRNRA